MNTDIINEKDIELLVNNFYNKLLLDELMAPHFHGLDLKNHIPRIISFWEMVLLDKPGYKTNVFDKHSHLQINQKHFDRWVELFSETVDEFFSGEKANLAKHRAAILGYTFGSKMASNN
jgi:hemoglobin